MCQCLDKNLGIGFRNLQISPTSYAFSKTVTFIGDQTFTGDTTFTGAISQDGGANAFNEAGADYDFKIEGDTDTALFYVDAGNDRVGISTNTPATAFEVQGTSTLDAVTIGGAVSQDAGAVAFNEAGGDYDFKVEGDTDTALLYVDAGNDRVGFGTSTPTSECIVDINGTCEVGAVRIAAQDTPANSLEVGVLGEMKFDDDYI